MCDSQEKSCVKYISNGYQIALRDYAGLKVYTETVRTINMGFRKLIWAINMRFATSHGCTNYKEVFWLVPMSPKIWYLQRRLVLCKSFYSSLDSTSLISLILEPPLPMSEPHWLAGTTSLRVTGGLLVAGLLLIELIISWGEGIRGFIRRVRWWLCRNAPSCISRNCWWCSTLYF